MFLLDGPFSSRRLLIALMKEIVSESEDSSNDFLQGFSSGFA